MVFIAHLSYSFSKFLFHVRAYGIWPNNMSSGREMIPCEEIRNRCRVKICRLKLYVIIQYYKKWKIFKFAFHGSKAPYEKMLFYIFYSFFFTRDHFAAPWHVIWLHPVYVYTTHFTILRLCFLWKIIMNETFVSVPVSFTIIFGAFCVCWCYSTRIFPLQIKLTSQKHSRICYSNPTFLWPFSFHRMSKGFKLFLIFIQYFMTTLVQKSATSYFPDKMLKIRIFT